MDAAPTRRAGRPYDIIVWYAPERTSVHRCIGASRVQRLARRIENSRKLAYGPLHLQVFSLNGVAIKGLSLGSHMFPRFQNFDSIAHIRRLLNPAVKLSGDIHGVSGGHYKRRYKE
ncbi:hypothetical protein SeMB42_g05473 [Synchytrium endobioticum]|uniref:Uncharacterized protein n=1 Tax=Synchytrium endobioticum TaxID=286115 RepID=A0A507CR65_9FUNG|nr:hypothetical protein SeMB42_g05473 [Synchytrium endobioticum]